MFGQLQAWVVHVLVGIKAGEWTHLNSSWERSPKKFWRLRPSILLYGGFWILRVTHVYFSRLCAAVCFLFHHFDSSNCLGKRRFYIYSEFATESNSFKSGLTQLWVGEFMIELALKLQQFGLITSFLWDVFKKQLPISWRSCWWPCISMWPIGCQVHSACFMANQPAPQTYPPSEIQKWI